MLKNQTQKLIEQLTQFRQALYDCFDARQDTVMDLLDALASNTSARSTVELSLNPLFRRDYSALYKAIASAFSTDSAPEKDSSSSDTVEQLLTALARVVPETKTRPYLLLGLDATPNPRPYARTLSDRTFIYQPNPIKGNKPINIGHPYSILSVLPEKDPKQTGIWVIPLSASRVESEQTEREVGTEQINELLAHPAFDDPNQWYVLAVDSGYSARPFLCEQAQHQNLVTVVRVRSNRVFYQSPQVGESQKRRGHPQWYGERFDLKDETSWHPPDETTLTTLTTHRGQLLTATITAWHQMLSRGTRNCPMHLHPFSLIHIVVTDESGKAIWRPMWLSVFGQCRHQLKAEESWQAYRQRYDLEHFLRFGKQKLLMTAFQTPEVEHEEHWVQLTLLAYVQLWAARSLAVNLPRSWERYLPYSRDERITPTVVQRDFNRIISQIGTPAKSSKRRGFSTGRAVGQSQTPRPRHPVLKKGAKRSQKTIKAA